MRGDDRWRIRKGENRLYRVRSARLGCDRRFFLLWNTRKASLGFGGATNSEFAEFLLHLPTEGALKPARLA